MNLTANPRQVDLGALIAFAVVIAGAYFGLFHHGIMHYFSLKAQEKLLREQLGGTASIHQTLQGFQLAIDETETRLQNLHKRLPKETNIDDILQQITQASSRTRVVLRLIEPMEMIEG